MTEKRKSEHSGKATSRPASMNTTTSTSSRNTNTQAKRNTQAASKGRSDTQHGQAHMNVSPEERMRMIQEAAYFLAMNGNGTDEVGNWLRAEQEIDLRIRSIN